MTEITDRYQKVGRRVFERAFEQNEQNIRHALAANAPLTRLLDLGCDDGERTVRFAESAQASEIYGVEVVEERAALASDRGIHVTAADLGKKLPYDDAFFDAVVSNQVIEHLYDTDIFISETFRVLKPGGVVATSTENLASWHNVASLVLGWQPFSLTNVSTTGSIGNPVGLHAGETMRDDHPDSVTWQHRRVFATRGLCDLHEAHGFVHVECLGAGYYPLPGRLGKLNPSHAAFITVVGRHP